MLIIGDRSPFSSIFTVTKNKGRSSSQVEMAVVHSGDNNIKTSKTSKALLQTKDYDIEVLDLMPCVCVDITVLLTFGLAFPLLAIPIMVGMFINTLLLRLAIGRYIVIVSSVIGKAACHQKLENDFQDAWKGLLGYYYYYHYHYYYYYYH